MKSGRTMAKAKTIHVYLPEPMRRDAAAGRVNIINRIAASVKPFAGRLVFHSDDPKELAKAPTRAGSALFHMTEPLAPTGLTLRRAYYYPFWQIENCAARWSFDVAKAAFDPVKIDSVAAKSFFIRLHDRVLGQGAVARDGYIFMPLQGRLSEHRSFQSASPLAMIDATLAHSRDLPIFASLHPKENYSASDMAALADLEQRFPRFRLVQADAIGLLRGCDYVVTQNSALALSGYLLQKPAVLFAGTDFHHIAGSVPRDGVEEAFARCAATAPDFSAYIYWFFKGNTINAGSPEAERQITERLRRHGWLP